MKQINIFTDYVEEKALEQFNKAMSLSCNVAGALMPDVHNGYTLPIGAVIKSKGKIFPAYVGYDIGCGVASVKLNLKSNNLSKEYLEKIKNEILNQIPVGGETHKKPQTMDTQIPLKTSFSKELFYSIGLHSIGTLGGGNHFLEIGEDENDFVWITVHSGSRKFGAKIAQRYMMLAAFQDTEQYIKEFESKNSWKEHNLKGWEEAKINFLYNQIKKKENVEVEEHYGFDINSILGKNYFLDMNSALKLALENRKTMINKTIKIIETILNRKIEKLQFINRNHNHAEMKDDYIIHRKGATHAEKGMFGVIPANMKDGCFIVKGKGYAPALNSSSHGAGRVLSRKEAKKQISFLELQDNMKDIITNITEKTIDESPKVYKNISDVMENQKKMVEVIYHIKPILNIKG